MSEERGSVLMILEKYGCCDDNYLSLPSTLILIHLRLDVSCLHLVVAVHDSPLQSFRNTIAVGGMLTIAS